MYGLNLCCPLARSNPEELISIRPLSHRGSSKPTDNAVTPPKKGSLKQSGSLRSKSEMSQAKAQFSGADPAEILIVNEHEFDCDLDREADFPLKIPSRTSFFNLFRKTSLSKSQSAGALKGKKHKSPSTYTMDRPPLGSHSESHSGPSSASSTPRRSRKSFMDRKLTQRKSENALMNGRAGTPPPQAKIELKVVILGSMMVGKTALSNQFQYKVFIHDYTPTVEDFGWIEYDMNWAEVMLQIIDTAGSHDFLAMRNLYMRTGDAFLLVFSVDDLASWEEAQSLYREIKALNGKKAPIQVVANKTDKFADESEWTVPRTQIDRFISENRANLAEISAKDYEQVQQVFRQLLQQTQMSSMMNEPLKKRRQSTPAAIRNRGSGTKISNEDLERLRKAAASQEARSRSGSCKLS